MSNQQTTLCTLQSVHLRSSPEQTAVFCPAALGALYERFLLLKANTHFSDCEKSADVAVLQAARAKRLQ